MSLLLFKFQTMTKNLKLFFKSLSFSNILFKVFILFFVGFFFRFLINYLNFMFIEYLSFLYLSLFANLFYFSESVNPKFYDDNLILFKRPRERVINENISNDFDYKFKDKLRRKCHWVFLEQFSSEFTNYKTFKEHWTPNKKYSNLLKNHYYEKKYKVTLFKKTFMWFINRRNEG
uniref:hypothetical protein n=1 Tax=Purpureocillium takamizusanense TaxID=2060973 RepID=UPI001FA6E6E9|nr:hypothetical protein MRV25_mgp20 [Purpureocillium takamizusanense]UNI92573.1 hypothetical protein [Purpureocillium takamizusanense]